MSKRRELAAEEVRGFFPEEPEPEAEEATGWRTAEVEEEYSQRYGRPTTYRLPDPLRDRIKEIAEAEGLPISELAEFALARFVKAYDAGKIRLQTKPVAFTIVEEPED